MWFGLLRDILKGKVQRRVVSILTIMAQLTPEDKKEVIPTASAVGAVREPPRALLIRIRPISYRRAGLKPAPTKPCFVVTLMMFFTLTFMAQATPNDEIQAGFRPKPAKPPDFH